MFLECILVFCIFNKLVPCCLSLQLWPCFVCLSFNILYKISYEFMEMVFVIDQRWNLRKYKQSLCWDGKWVVRPGVLNSLKSFQQSSTLKCHQIPRKKSVSNLEACKGVLGYLFYHRVIAHNFNYRPVSANAFKIRFVTRSARQQQLNRKPKTYVSSNIFTHLHVFVLQQQQQLQEQ